MPLRVGSDIELIIEKPVTGGRMLGRHEGQVVLVAGAIPGEVVRARIEKISAQVAFARTLNVVQRSVDRRADETDWACGGSLYAHIAYQRQLNLKSELIADAFGRIGKIPISRQVPIVASPDEGYRTRARLHASGGRFGFFREGTHELCDAAPTRQLATATVEALGLLSRALASSPVQVSSCELAENVAGTERAVLLELAAGQSGPLSLDAVEGLSGVVFAEHETTRLTPGYGSPFVTDVIALQSGEITLVHHVQSFFQGNRFLCGALAKRVVEHIARAPIVDLYAGVGLFALAAAAAGHEEIVAVEGDRSSGRDLEENAAPFMGAVSVRRTSVEQYLHEKPSSGVATLVLDPPRTGMSKEALTGILRLAPPNVVYVSCDLATVARDVRRLVDAGYSLEHIEGFDLFPNTAHVETVVVMQK